MPARWLLLFTAVAAADEAADRERWPLIYAAGEGDAARVHELLDAGHGTSERSADGETALHVAGIKGDEATVRALINGGADVNARTPRGSTLQMTPLHWAVYHGHAAMVELLLEAGADPTILNERGSSAMDAAAEIGQDSLRERMAAAAAKLPYKPCRGKSEGDSCSLCAPADEDCFETMELKACSADGKCHSAASGGELDDMPM